MKKLTVALLALVFLFSGGMTVRAAEATLDMENDQTEISVYARAEDSTEWIEAPVEDGKAEVQLPDGTEITAEGIENDDWTLIIYIIPETDEEAVDWFENMLAGEAEDIAVYHIYFLDEDGNVYDADGVTVTIDLPENMEDPGVYAVTTAGELEVLAATMGQGKITFTTDGSPYYALGTTRKNTGPAPTGDRILPWLLLMLASGTALAVTMTKGRKKYA